MSIAARSSKTLLLVSTEIPPTIGGIGRFADNLISGFYQLGIRVVLVTSVRNARPSTAVETIRTPTLVNRKGLKLLPLAMATWHACRKHRPDAIVAMNWTHEGISAWIATRLIRVPYIVVTHGSDLLRRHGVAGRRHLMARVLRDAAVVVANSAFTRDLLMQLGIERGRVAVVHPPVAVSTCGQSGSAADDLERRLGLQEKRVIFTAARLVERKGHADVIRALGRLRERYPNLVYVMTGVGAYARELQQLAAEYGVEDRVRLAGWVEESEVHQLHCRADVYVSPSRLQDDDVEGFGIALIEAALHGKPVVAGRAGGVAEAVIDGETGLLIDPSDPDALYAALTRLLDSPDLRTRLGNAGKIRAAREFAPKSRAEKVLRLLPVLACAVASHRD